MKSQYDSRTSYHIPSYKVSNSGAKTCNNLCCNSGLLISIRDWYVLHGRYCSKCSKAFNTTAKYCFCCGVQLRTMPRHKLTRARRDKGLKRY